MSSVADQFAYNANLFFIPKKAVIQLPLPGMFADLVINGKRHKVPQWVWLELESIGIRELIHQHFNEFAPTAWYKVEEIVIRRMERQARAIESYILTQESEYRHWQAQLGTFWNNCLRAELRVTQYSPQLTGKEKYEEIAKYINNKLGENYTWREMQEALEEAHIALQDACNKLIRKEYRKLHKMQNQAEKAPA